MLKTISLRGQRLVLGAILLVFGAENSARATLIYWQNFEGGDGTEDSGFGSGGNLGLLGSATFATTSGSFGNVLDVTANTGSTLAGTSLVSTTATGGSVVNLGTLTDFTITMWVNTAEFGTGGGSLAGRVIVLGDSGTTDALQAGTFAVTQAKSDYTGAGGPTGFNLFYDTSTIASAIGGLNTANEWTFIAISSSTSVADAFYRGTDTASVVSTAVTIPNTGVVIGTSGVVLLGNRSSGGRAYDGLIDDVRIYNTALTASEVEDVRREAIIVPEPTTASLLGVCLIGLGLARRCGSPLRVRS